MTHNNDAGPTRPSVSTEADAATAREKSAKIIAEQLAKTKALRDKKLAKAAAAYQASVLAFFAPSPAAATARASGSEGGGLTFSDIPWPCTNIGDNGAVGGSESKDEAAAVEAALYGITDAAARKRAIRKEQVRWHPDKWAGQMKKRIDAQDFEKVMARVTEISKAFNALAA